MKKLLYFFPVKTSFVTGDFEILSKKYNVRTFYFKPLPKWKTPFYFVYQFFFILFNLSGLSIMYSQFSGYHTFLPSLFCRLLNKKHFIVLNGTECNNFPEINYGYLSRPLLFWFSEKSLKWATKLLPASDSLVSDDYTFMKTTYKQQGYTHFYKNVSTPYTVIHNGLSVDLFHIDLSVSKLENSFITVAAGLESENRRIVKGLDTVIELAKITPGYSYTIVGGKKPTGLEVTDNIQFLDFIPHDELSVIYNRHQFYLQLSVSEGFGISLCEAMLTGCVPIVSDVGMLPEIAGPHGYILPFKNISLLQELVKKAITEYAPENSILYRQHIIDHYSIKERELKLLKAMGQE